MLAHWAAPSQRVQGFLARRSVQPHVRCQQKRDTRRLTIVRASDEPPKETEEAGPSAPAENPIRPTPKQPTPNTNASKILAGAGMRGQAKETKELALPREVIERLKTVVFGFDTFFVTGLEPYQEGGVIFKGNLKAKDPAVAYAKMKGRLAAELGDKYTLFLMENAEGVPNAVVLPSQMANAAPTSKANEVLLAALFAVATAVTSFSAFGTPLLEWIGSLGSPGNTPISGQDFADALPATLAFWFILGSHEFGHQWAGRRHGITFYLPFVIPAGFGFLGSFGTLTRPQQILPSREAQLDIAVRGPLLGAAVSLALALAGFALSGTGLDPAPVTIDSPGFLDSLLMATLAQAFLGDALAQPEVKVSALMLAGWAGLVVNALACVPAGELDGGRIAVSLFGRRAGQSLGSFAYLSMAVGAFSSALAFYYIGLTLFLQRGPLLPCSEEVSAPKDAGLRAAGLALLALPLLVLLPYPVDLMAALAQLGDPVPF